MNYSVLQTSDYGVYEATRNDTNEVVYIGCSWTGMKVRLDRHITMLKGNRHPNSGLQKLWNAKGLTFTHVVRCLPIKKLALAFEKAYGAQYDFKKLMNVNPLGQETPDTTGIEISQEHKDQISKKLKGKKRPEHSKMLTGRKRPDHSETMIKLWKDPEYISNQPDRSGKNNSNYNHVLDNSKEEILFLYYNTDFTLNELGELFNSCGPTISKRIEEWA
jgi:hypothetical protein